jgi:Cof subfamily protein (haloacid dehalogenase superfamily)
MVIPRHLIALDLDGTLLNKDKKISKATLTYLKRIKEQHVIVLATGRPYRSFIKYYQQLGLNTPMVCYNGAYVTNPTDSTFKTSSFAFPQEVVKQIYLDVGVDHLDNVMCETNVNIWLLKEEKNLASFFWHDNMNIIYGPLENTLNENPMTMILKVKKRNQKLDQMVFKAVKKHSGLKVRFWGSSQFCEIYYQHISKGSALLSLLKQYRIPRKHFMSFGDAENDKEMLQLASISYVMKNADSHIKKYGKFLTKKDNQHDGIIDELQRYFKGLSSLK